MFTSIRVPLIPRVFVAIETPRKASSLGPDRATAALLFLPFGWWQHEDMWSYSGQCRAQSIQSALKQQHWHRGGRLPSPCRERGREREEEEDLVTEDEDAVGRGCCSRVCKEAKTSSGTDCEPSPKMHRQAPLDIMVLWILHHTRGTALWGLSRCRGTTREVPLHCHRRWQISLLSAGSKSIVLRLVPCKVMLHLCAINMLSLWQFFSSTRVSHSCQQCCFAFPLRVIKVLLSVCVYTQAPVSAALAKVVWRSRNYCLLMCPYPGSDVVHRSADAAGQPLQDRADPSANYQSHPSWQQRRRRRYQERQWWRPEQLHMWRLESLKHICL